MSNYRRSSKPKTEHIKKGFTVFQKTIATLGSILGLITASITIMSAMDKNKKEPTPSPQQTTIIREGKNESRTDTRVNNEENPVKAKEDTQPANNQEDNTKEDNNNESEQPVTSSSNNQAPKTDTTPTTAASNNKNP